MGKKKCFQILNGLILVPYCNHFTPFSTMPLGQLPPPSPLLCPTKEMSRNVAATLQHPVGPPGYLLPPGSALFADWPSAVFHHLARLSHSQPVNKKISICY